MGIIERVSARSVAVGLVAVIVLGGFVVALFAGAPNVLSTSAAPAAFNGSSANYVFGSGVAASGAGSLSNLYASTETVTSMSTTTEIAQGPQQTVVVGGTPGLVSKSSATSFNQPGNGSLIEFFSNMTMESPTPATLASKVVELAYSVGGYVAYQSTLTDSSYLVVRVPAADYQQVVSQIQGMGNVTSVTSNSNDVTVKYTDLNATLASLVAERNDLLKLITQSTSVNSTLAIESQLQAVNAQINSIESEILQTQRLITYSTISLSISKSAVAQALSMKLSATPKSGVSPVGVTFNSIVSGGAEPYIINYNFGDGTSQQGQAVIHQFYGADDYNVTVTATDAKGNVTTAWTIIRVTEPPTKVGFGDFGVNLEALVVHVVEGMAEIAVVILPIALIAVVVVYPFRRRSKMTKEIKQE
jgi:uncharacterized protein DUF4349/PKD domain-containing protein